MFWEKSSEVNYCDYQIEHSIDSKWKTIGFVQGEKPAGEYSIIRNGENEKGELVSSGTYFYTLKVGKNTLISKQM